MYTQEDLYWVWLCSQTGIGAVKRAALLEYCGKIAKVYEASEQEYRKAGLKQEEAARLAGSKDLTVYQKLCRSWNEQGIELLCRDSPLYPQRLLNIYPPVDLLFLRGDVHLLQTSCISIVGSRRCSNYGAGVAHYLSQNLARAGYTIISGMAHGIDACAHQGALDARKKTIAVLGCGIDICYPKGNLRLYERIAKWGLLISEYPPGMPPKPGFFPMRNRIIAALSRAVIVAEAASRSGALITVDQALEAGVEVFAVPGGIFEETSKGTNKLIKQGASILYDWKDVMTELGDAVPEEASPKGKVFQDEDTQKIWENLAWMSGNPQELAVKLGIEAGKFMQCMTMLELSGYVRRNPDGSIAKKEIEEVAENGKESGHCGIAGEG